MVHVSIIVPTLNEAGNLPLLVPRIDAAMAGRAYEVLIVDDSSADGTAEVCAQLAERYPLRLIVRQPSKEGLSGAVLEGMKQARGAVLVVMDADLQHPPEKIPELVAAVEGGRQGDRETRGQGGIGGQGDEGADFVIGSRYVPGGETEESWGVLRRMNSWFATVLARPFAGRVTDPMSGFFALCRSTYEQAERLTPLGYKIALELMCKARVRHVAEVPIHFGLRQHGRSKLTLKQQFKYLEHLSRLYDFTYPRASPIVKFLIATLCAWTAGAWVFLLLTWRGMDWSVSAPVSYLAAIGVTAVFHLRYVHTQREFIVRRRPWMDFWIISVCELAACAVLAKWIMERAPGVPAVEFFLLTFGGATVVRYILRKELLQDIRGLRRGVEERR
jgi:dolichol-phosphate mannosyltransferase